MNTDKKDFLEFLYLCLSVSICGFAFSTTSK